MPFFNRHFFEEKILNQNLGPLRALRILAMTLILLLGAEVWVRTHTLYDFDPVQRFQSIFSASELPPSAKQVGEALDFVRTHAQAGDIVLIGDSILNGTHVPNRSTPASVIRDYLKSKNQNGKVWDMSMVGAEPSTYLALLDRLGPLDGVLVLANVSLKLVVNPNDAALYFPEFWAELETWSTSSPEAREGLKAVSEHWYERFKDAHRAYGDNVQEARASAWINSHISLLTLDHWLRYQYTTDAWPKYFTKSFLGEKVYPAKAYDVIWGERPHEDPSIILNRLKDAEDSFATLLPSGDPLWRSYLTFLDRMEKRGTLGVVSLHTVSPYAIRHLPEPQRTKTMQAYEAFRKPAHERKLQLTEPSTYMPEQEYADLDHYGSVGNRRWILMILQTIGR